MVPLPQPRRDGHRVDLAITAGAGLVSSLFALQAHGPVVSLSVAALFAFVGVLLLRRPRRGLVRTLPPPPSDPERARFVAELSREIRTPMNGILGMTELLLDSALEGDQQEYAQTIHASTKALLTTVDQVLDLARVETGDLDLEDREFEIRACIQEAVESCCPDMAARGVELNYVVDPEIPRVVRGDPTRLSHLLENFLASAGEKEPGAVRLSVTWERVGEADLVLRFVIDAGSSSSFDTPTPDLRLAIGHGLVTMMGGEVVSTEHEISFTLSFDCPGVPDPMTGAIDALHGKRVLVVDDSPVVRSIVRTYAEAWGMHVVEAGSCKEGLERIRDASTEGAPFDVALVDEVMPGKGGREMARLAGVTSWVSETRLVLLIGQDRRLRPGMLLREGFSAWITKPLGYHKLEAALLHAVESAGEGGAGIFSEPEDRPRRVVAPDGTFDAEVLIVEDNVVNQKVACLLLESLGCRTTVAADGRSALRAIEAQLPDLVLMDCLMPVMDGFEATRAIRTSPDDRLRRLPVVAMTASALPEDKTRCLEAGMNDHLPKPVPLNGLRRILTQWVPNQTGTTSGDLPMYENEILDPEVIRSLKELGGDDDPSLFEELVQLFMDDTPMRIEELERSLVSGDSERLARAAHALKSSTANLGAMMLSELFKQIEQAGKENDLESAGGLVRRSQDEYQRVTQALKSELH